MISRTIVSAAALLCFAIPSSSGAQSVTSDILVSGSGGGGIAGGSFTEITGYILSPQGKMSSPKRVALIVAVLPRNMTVYGSGVEGTYGSLISTGATTMDVQTHGPKDTAHLKKIKLVYIFDGHMKKITIAKQTFDWAKHQVFVVVYDRKWKTAVYSLTRDFKGAQLPAETLSALKKEFSKGMDTPTR